MERKLIFEHEFADLYYTESKLLLEEIWKPATDEMTDEGYKAFQQEKLRFSREVMPTYFLCDTLNFNYLMTAEMQEWTDKKLNAFWTEINLKKFAFVAPQGFVEKLALELAMDESPLPYEVKFVTTAIEAEVWLLEK